MIISPTILTTQPLNFCAMCRLQPYSRGDTYTYTCRNVANNSKSDSEAGRLCGGNTTTINKHIQLTTYITQPYNNTQQTTYNKHTNKDGYVAAFHPFKQWPQWSECWTANYLSLYFSYYYTRISLSISLSLYLYNIYIYMMLHMKFIITWGIYDEDILNEPFDKYIR